MSPPILLDLSRLLSRARRPTPTGIDRIELAYAEHLIIRAADRLGFVTMNVTGELALVQTRIGRQLVETLGTAWRDPDDGWPAVRWAGLLVHLSALLPGRVTSSAWPRRPVYLLVSHQNLHRPARLERFKARSGAAFIVFVHDLIPMEYPEYVRPGHAERHRLRIETICALADGIIVNSQVTADALAPHLARAGRDLRVLVAHPGSEFAILSPQSTPALGERPYFVCLGTIEPRKNHLLLLHLWRQLAATRDAATPSLLLIGRRGWENENTVDILERCTAIAGLIEEYPALPDNALPKLLAGAQALLCPAFVEGYGLPIAEALALGVPVICSDIPVFREVGRDAPEFLSPLDGLGWLQAIRDYSVPNSPRRAAQLARLATWQAPRWEPHIDAVLELIEQISQEAGGMTRKVSPAQMLTSSRRTPRPPRADARRCV
jgi:glycosyltransferase involved in cell wall biosynthesis